MRRSNARKIRALFVFVAFFFASPFVRADDDTNLPPLPRRHRLVWDDNWVRMRPLEYVGAAAIDIGALGVLFLSTSSDHAKWDHPLPLDEPLRNAIRLRTVAGLRYRARSSATPFAAGLRGNF